MGSLQTRPSLLRSLGCQVPANGAASPAEGRKQVWPFHRVSPLPRGLWKGTYQPKEGHIIAPPLRVCFLQLHYNAAFIMPLNFYFSKHFGMCGLILFYETDNLTSHQAPTGNTVLHSLRCAVLQVLSLLLSSHSKRH